MKPWLHLELREDGNDEEEILQHHTSNVGKRE